MQTENYLEPQGFKGTPGEWEIGYGESGFLDNGDTIESDGKTICHVEIWEDDDDAKIESEANAKIISKSKELAKALQDSSNHFMKLCYSTKIWEHIGVSEEWLRKQIETNNQVLKEAGLTNE